MDTYNDPDHFQYLRFTAFYATIGLPLLNLGWTFTLSLTREVRSSQEKVNKKGLKGRASSYTWRPVAFSFRQHDK